ncbi:MAG: TraR/DksA C4-type zinc finger protein [Gemmataceae bacterium]|nr:TraR/DksA C4-type zinc finger protein [Gemmataceae bacterium]
MARRDALLRLHKNLTARRDELRKRLGGELRILRDYKSLEGGDAADMAFDSGSEEVTSQLAQLEAREVVQIERALARLKQGTYGVCEGCGKKIAVARLNALPFSTACVPCQREMEIYGSFEGRGAGNWDKVSDAPIPLEEQRELKLSELEFDMSSNR